MTAPHLLAARLPDIPRWVEARSLLLSGQCAVFGLREEPTQSFVVRDLSIESVTVVGSPSSAAILDAVKGAAPWCSLCSPMEEFARIAELLPDWYRSRAIFHLLKDSSRLPQPKEGQVVFMDPAIISTLSLEDDLRRELLDAAEETDIATTIIDGQPAAFCYSGSVTETLWDISIDTRPEYRRRGAAGLAASFLIRCMQAQGKEPVWGSDVENPASWMLAKKLGFEVVDEIALFERS